MVTTIGGRLSLSANQNRVSDEDLGSVQRLSFVSSSTGYSSARSSLRSSEIGEESFLSRTSDLSIERRIITRESLLSETRRLKLMKRSTISQLDRIAMELLETERCYVNDLSDIIQGYLNFFIGHREQFQMTVDDVSNTFGCIERIYLFNKRLFYQLDRALLNVVQMARCFVENIDGFKDYVTYCANYQKMVDTLSCLMKNNSITETLSARQSLLGHSLPLTAYLLKPVQRVLKYHLFMENILKQSTETRNLSDSDIGTVKKALVCLTSLADKINEEKKRVEHGELVRELQSALQSWSLDKRNDLVDYGELVFEGTFKLAGSKTNRQLFLFEEMLLIVKKRSDSLICKDYIMCSSIMLNESVGPDPLAFQVMSYDNPKVQYVFAALNLEQKRKWMKELKRMMLDHYDAKIPEKAKLLMLNTDNVSTKPTVVSSLFDDKNAQGCKVNRKIPKYLEKKRKMQERSSKLSLQKTPNSMSSKNMAKLSVPDDILLCTRADMKNGRHEANNLKCTCSYDGVLHKVDENGASECSSGLNHMQQPCCTSSSFLSNLFVKRKSAELANMKHSLTGRKNGTYQTSSTAHHLSPNSNIGFSSSKSEGELLRCTCQMLDPSVSPMSYSSTASSCSLLEKPRDCSLVRACEELNESLSNAQASDICLEHKFPKCERFSPFERNPATVCTEENLQTGEFGDVHKLEQRRCRSKSLNRLDEATCLLPAIDASFPLIDSAHDGYIVNSIEDDAEAFINGSAFGKFLDEEMQGRLQESEREDEEEVVNVMSWVESPAVRDRMKARKNLEQGQLHRRRSSQVAELVWRLKQKQDSQKKTEDESNENTFDQVGVPKNSVASALRGPPESVGQDAVRMDSGLSSSALLSSARQRTPLTEEQRAQLDDLLLEPQLGVVKEMIKQLETHPRTAFRVL